MHTFQVQSSISQFQPLLGELSGSSGALDTSFSFPVVWGGVPESTGTGELLAGAAAACYLITTNMAAGQANIKLSKLEVTVEGDMVSDRSGVRISELRLYPVIAVDGSEEQRRTDAPACKKLFLQLRHFQGYSRQRRLYCPRTGNGVSRMIVHINGGEIIPYVHVD